MTVGITELPPEGMQLGGVALAGDTERGTRTTEGLSLLFTTAGITVQGPQPQIERLLVWSGLDSATCNEKIVLPDGRDAAVMELTSGGQSIRFLLPTSTVSPGQAAYLDQALPAWLSRYKGQPTAPTADGAATAGAATGAAATGTASAVENHPGGDAAVVLPPPPSAPSPAPPSAPAAAPGPRFAPATATAAGVAAAAGAAAAAEGQADNSGNASVPEPAPTGTGAIAEADRASSAAPTLAAAPLSPPPPPAPPLPAPPTAVSAGGPAPWSAVSPTGPIPPGAEALPPPPLPGLASASPVVAGWEFSTDSVPGATAWDNPPLGQPLEPAADLPSQKTKGWRKSRSPEIAPVPPPGATAPPQQPVGAVPPEAPPPPPPGATGAPAPPRPVTWQPPIDPVTGEAQWDRVDVVAASSVPVEETPKKKRGWRKGRKGAAAGAAAAPSAGAAAAPSAGAAAAPSADTAAAPSADTAAAPPGPPRPAPPGGDPFTADGGGLATDAQGAAAPWSPGAQSSQHALTPEEAALGVQPPGGALPGQPATELPAGTPASKGRRSLLIGVLVAVLLVAVAGIAYLLVKKHNSTTTPATTAAPSREAMAYQLAQSINLRLTDLPAGWTYTTVRGLPPEPLAAPAAAVLSANQALATCVSQPVYTVAALLGNSAPGQVAVATSATFQSGSDPAIHMSSVTRTMGAPSEAQALATPFAAPNFPNCFGQYQTTLAAASVPGSTAQVQTVTLSAPTGVQSFGYVTTFTIPGKGTEVVGQAYIIGGPVEARLTPSTNGPPIPPDAFVPAYNAMAGRVAQVASK